MKYFNFWPKAVLKNVSFFFFFPVFWLNEPFLGAIDKGELNSVAQGSVTSDDCIII